MQMFLQQQHFIKKVIEFQTQRRAAIDKMTTQRAEAREKLMKKLEPIIDTYIRENNISLVLDKKDMIGGMKEIDITSTIIEKLDKELQSLNLK